MKEKILEILKRGEMTTTAISEYLKENYWKTYALLQELEKEGKIIREKKPHQTFWHLANSLFNLNKGAGLAFGDSKDPASLRAVCPSSTQTDDKKTKQEKGGEK